MSCPKYSHNIHSPRNCSRTDESGLLRKKVEKLKQSLRSERKEKEELVGCLNYMKDRCEAQEVELNHERMRAQQLESQLQRLKLILQCQPKQQPKPPEKKEKVQVGGYFGSLFR